MFKASLIISNYNRFVPSVNLRYLKYDMLGNPRADNEEKILEHNVEIKILPDVKLKSSLNNGLSQKPNIK